MAFLGSLSPIDYVSSALRSHPQVIPLLLSYLCIRSFRKLRAFAVGLLLPPLCPCGRRYRPQTTTPYPPLPKVIGVSSRVSPFLLSTLLDIPWKASRVHRVGLHRDDVDGAF